MKRTLTLVLAMTFVVGFAVGGSAHVCVDEHPDCGCGGHETGHVHLCAIGKQATVTEDASSSPAEQVGGPAGDLVPV